MADNVSKEKIIIDFKTNADDAKKDIDNLVPSIKKTIDVTDDLADSNKQLHDSFEDVYGDLKPLTARLGEAEDRLYELALAGKTATDEYKGLLEIVAKYKQTQQETDRVVDAAATTMAQKLGGASQLAATGVQGATSAMALFGDQSEDTEKALLKVQAAMAFADSISSISEMGGQWRILKTAVLESSIATKANTAATGAAAIVTKLFGGSVDTTSKGFKGLKVAIAGTGIGLLVVGLVALIQNFDKVKKVVLNFVPGLEAVGEQIMSIVEAVTDFVGLTSEADRAIDKMKANADASIALNKKFIEEHGSQLDEFTKQKVDAVNEYHELIKEDGANQVALYAELQRKLGIIDDEREAELQKKRDEAAKKREEERKKREEEAKKAEEERIRLALEAIKNREALEAEQAAELQRAKDELIDTTYEDAEQKKLDHEVDMAGIAARQREIDYDNQKLIDEKILANKKENQDRLVSQGEQLIKNVASLAGKNKAIQKAAIIADGGVAVGKAVANTAEAVTKDLAKGMPFSAPLVALDLAVGATSIASIIQGTSKALQAVGGGGSISAPTLPGAPIGVNATPQTGFQASSENQIATSINGANQSLPPIKTYVVGQEITTQQGLDAALVKDNSFGGVVVKP